MNKDVQTITCGDCGKTYSEDDPQSWLYIPYCCRQYIITDPYFCKVAMDRMSQKGPQSYECPMCETPIYFHMGVQTSGGYNSHYWHEIFHDDNCIVKDALYLGRLGKLNNE